MERTAAEELPDYAQLDYKGESREYRTAGGAVLFTFAMALLIVYLVLAAQFESFIHPIVIMLTVPLAVLGALIGLALTGGTLNLFSQIGIVMLVGLAAKNGILIVDFANQLRDEGRNVRRGHRRGGQRATAPDPHDFDRNHGGRGAARARRRPGFRQPLDHRCRRDLRRGVLDPSVACSSCPPSMRCWRPTRAPPRRLRSASRRSRGKRPRSPGPPDRGCPRVAVSSRDLLHNYLIINTIYGAAGSLEGPR